MDATTEPTPAIPNTMIEYAEWPRDVPSAMERNIITIVCGNTRLHWALHEGCLNKFIPIMFWHTAHDDEKEGPCDDTDPCDLLEAHVASQAHTLIFGNGNNRGCIKDVSDTAAKRDAPGISIFVVSSNPDMEKKICHMFRDVPAKLYKLRNTDFFPPENGLYPTMGVDRVAALYGAKLHYGAPVLVIDGGTAMTYSVLDNNAQIIGGGISPGVKVRLQSLADYTGSLPIIDHEKFKSTVEGAMSSKSPLPFFAKDTEMAMISPVCGELACQLRNIIKQYISRCQSASEVEGSRSKTSNRFPVIITGGDGKFLHDLIANNASGIVSVEPDASPIPTNIDVRYVKNLVTYALGDVINEKYSEKPMTPEEKLRLKIQGLRIALPEIDQKEVFSRGCVFKITSESMIEGYLFHARFDNGIRKDLTLRELYDSLVLYNEIGEKRSAKATLSVDEDWVIEKKMWSKKVQEELGNVSRSVRNRMRQLKPHIEKGELKEVFKRRSVKLRTSTKKAKRTVGNPKQHLGKRIAKRFPIEVNEDDSSAEDAGDQIFFGTVKYISDPRLLWYFVSYDDGDMEDIHFTEVLEGLDLYEIHKFNDPRHGEPEDSSQLLSVGSKPLSALLHTEKEGTVCTDLSTLSGLSASDGCNAPVESIESIRKISEFKEEI